MLINLKKTHQFFFLMVEATQPTSMEVMGKFNLLSLGYFESLSRIHAIRVLICIKYVLHLLVLVMVHVCLCVEYRLMLTLLCIKGE